MNLEELKKIINSRDNEIIYYYLLFKEEKNDQRKLYLSSKIKKLMEDKD